MSSTIHVTAPARVCLFGDHQDYLGLPVIACAIDRELSLMAKENHGAYFNIEMPDIDSVRKIDITNTFETLALDDHLGAALRVARKYGCDINRGYDIRIHGDIPINAGVSSSSAVVVAWIHFLLKAFGDDSNVTAKRIGQLAYEAEVIEHHAPGGKMDQYTIALGGLIHIHSGEPFECSPLANAMPGLILGESGIPKKTIGVLGDVRTKAEAAIDCVKKIIPNFEIERSCHETILKHQGYVPTELQPYFDAAVQNYLITKEALPLCKNPSAHLEAIGTLMSKHHAILRDNLNVSVPQIDRMIKAAIAAGAYGAKIVGSGGGGSMVALAPKDKHNEIIEALLKNGAVKAYPVAVGKGTQIHTQ